MRHHLNVFAGVAVAQGGGLFGGVHNGHFGVIAPSGGGGTAGRLGQGGNRCRCARNHLFGQQARGADQPHRRVRPVLGLADQVGGDDVGVGAVVGNHQRLGGTRHHVNPHLPEQQALGFGHVAVARAYDDVRRLARKQTLRQRGDGLHPAQGQHDVRAAELQRIQNGRVDAVRAVCRGGRHDVLDAGYLGCAHAHDGAGRVGVAPSGHVATRRLAGNKPLPGAQTGHEFDIELLHGRALLPGKVGHALVGKADVVFHALRQGFFGARECLGSEHDGAVPAVQGMGVSAHPVFAADADFAQHGLHRLGGRGVGALGCQGCGLEVVRRHKRASVWVATMIGKLVPEPLGQIPTMHETSSMDPAQALRAGVPQRA